MPIKPLKQVKTARYSERRVNAVLKEYGYTSDDFKTKALLGFVSPADFLAATTTPDLLADIENRAKELDQDKLAGESQVVTLYGTLSGNKFKITGHEGRHRMVAFKRAVVGLVPVVFDLGSAQKLEPIENLVVTGQELDDERGKGFRLATAIPVSWNEAINGSLRNLFQANANFSGITF